MYDGTALDRIDGTETEMVLDIVTINTKENKIFITRVGAGEDLEINI